MAFSDWGLSFVQSEPGKSSHEAAAYNPSSDPEKPTAASGSYGRRLYVDVYNHNLNLTNPNGNSHTGFYATGADYLGVPDTRAISLAAFVKPSLSGFGGSVGRQGIHVKAPASDGAYGISNTSVHGYFCGIRNLSGSYLFATNYLPLTTSQSWGGPTATGWMGMKIEVFPLGALDRIKTYVYHFPSDQWQLRSDITLNNPTPWDNDRRNGFYATSITGASGSGTIHTDNAIFDMVQISVAEVP